MCGTKWVKVSRQAIDFCRACLTRDPNNRPTIVELFEHDWIKKWVKDPVIKAETELHISESIV